MQANIKQIVLKSREQRILRALKPLRSSDERRCAYLYADGSLAVWYKRTDRQTGAETSYWKIARGAAEIADASKGRLVLHYGAAFLLLAGPRVSWRAESVKHGSENSKRIGLPVGSVNIGRDNFRDDAHIVTIDGTLSSDFCAQEDARPWEPDYDAPLVEEYVAPAPAALPEKGVRS